MSKYYIIESSLIDKEIPLNKVKLGALENSGVKTHDFYRLQGIQANLESLKSKSELVEIEDINEEYTTRDYVISGHKLIKTIAINKK